VRVREGIVRADDRRQTEERQQNARKSSDHACVSGWTAQIARASPYHGLRRNGEAPGRSRMRHEAIALIMTIGLWIVLVVTAVASGYLPP
jgi:hypothetical protein